MTPRTVRNHHIIVNKKNRRKHDSKIPIARFFRDTKGVRGFLNNGVKLYFGYGNYVEFGIDFQNKTLIIIESSKYIEDAYIITHPMRVPPTVLEEIQRRVEIPRGESTIIGEYIEDGIVFDLKKIRRRIKEAKNNYGYY